jgi:hypothetical protein
MGVKKASSSDLRHGTSATDSEAFGNVTYTSCDLTVPPMAVCRSHNTSCATKLHCNASVVPSLADLLCEGRKSGDFRSLTGSDVIESNSVFLALARGANLRPLSESERPCETRGTHPVLACRLLCLTLPHPPSPSLSTRAAVGRRAPRCAWGTSFSCQV